MTARIHGGLYHPSQPAAANEFRDRTAVHAKMAGVEEPHFTCASCGKFKPARGRKLVTPGSHRAGYVCTDCQTIDMSGYAGHKKPGVDYSIALRDRLRPLLTAKAMTNYEMAHATGREHCTVQTIIKKLRKTPGTIFIESWCRVPGQPGPMQARYRWGDDDDAPKPARDTNAEKLQRHRNRNKGVHHSKLVKGDLLMSVFCGGR